jgi:hypothetical protein
MRTLHEYRVVWEIDIHATSPRQAARKALAIQRDASSLATVFDVYRTDTGSETDALKLLAGGEPARIDLEDYRARRRRK